VDQSVHTKSESTVNHNVAMTNTSNKCATNKQQH